MDREKLNLAISGLVFAGALALFIIFVMHYQKWEATWWGINIFFYGIPGVGLAAGVKWGLEEFLGLEEWKYTYSWRPVVVACIGVPIFILMGSTFTEPKLDWGGAVGNAPKSELKEIKEAHHTHYYTSTHYYGDYHCGYYYNTPWARSSTYRNTMGTPLDVKAPSGTSSGGGGNIDVDGEGVIVLAIIILVIILAVGSALVPHFWVLACIIVLALGFFYLLNAALHYSNRREILRHKIRN